MSIDLFLICWNEAEILKMVIQHYQKFCRNITIFDNFSDDGSQMIAQSLGCIVKKFGKKGELSDSAYLEVKNNCWKGSDADYVIVCDADEILWPQNVELPTYLEIASPSIVKPFGWQVMSNWMPYKHITNVTEGYAFSNYSKCVLFTPKLKEIGFKPGAHVCEPVADFPIVISEFKENEGLYLMHYKNIGGVERLIKRNVEYMKRMSLENKKKGWGSHYWEPQWKTREIFNERLAISKPLVDERNV